MIDKFYEAICHCNGGFGTSFDEAYIKAKNICNLSVVCSFSECDLFIGFIQRIFSQSIVIILENYKCSRLCIQCLVMEFEFFQPCSSIF